MAGVHGRPEEDDERDDGEAEVELGFHEETDEEEAEVAAMSERASRLYAMALATRVYEAQCASPNTKQRMLNPVALAAEFVAIAIDSEVEEV